MKMKSLLPALTMLALNAIPGTSHADFACQEENFARDGGAAFALFDTQGNSTTATLLSVQNLMGSVIVKKEVVINLECSIQAPDLRCLRDQLAIDGARDTISLRESEKGSSIIEHVQEYVLGFSGELVKNVTSYGTVGFKQSGMKCGWLSGTESAALKLKIRELEKLAEKNRASSMVR